MFHAAAGAHRFNPGAGFFVREWRQSSWRQGRAVLFRQRVSLLDNTSYIDTHHTDPMLVLKNAARLPGSTAFPFSIHFICILFITSIHRMGLYCQAESVEQRIRLRIAKGGWRIDSLFRAGISVKKRTGTHPVLFLRRRLPGWGSGGGEVRSNRGGCGFEAAQGRVEIAAEAAKAASKPLRLFACCAEKIHTILLICIIHI